MYYEDNIKVMSEYKEYLYSRLNKFLDEGNLKTQENRLEGISIIKTKDNNTAVSITYEGKNYRLNSLYNPILEAKKWADQFAFKNIGIVLVMYGLGNGVFVRELIKKINEEHILLIYEPSADIFLHILEHTDITDILSAPNVSLTVEGINDNELRNLLMNHVNWINLNSQIVCVHPQYNDIFIESYKTFNKILLDSNNRAIVNNNTDMAISSQIINNTLNNLKFLKTSNLVTDLIGIFPDDVPAIVVAAGPSLDKNIDDLKEAKGKAVIFAVDTAVKYLLSHNIIPDFIVTLDPGKSPHHLSDERCRDIPLFCRIDSRPENLEANEKKLILYNLEGYIKNLFQLVGKNTGTLNSGGSVATGAFSICETMGFKRIILVGQDLAYSGESTHAGGLQVDVGGASRFLETVEDIYGNMIQTRYDWYVYIKWFEDAVDLFEGIEVIDATEGGAKIRGTSILTLKEVIKKYCNHYVTCEAIVDTIIPTLNNEEYLILKQVMEEHLKDLDEIKARALDGIKICESLIDKYERSAVETNASTIKNKKVTEINENIESKLIYELIDWDIAAATSKHMAELYTYTDDEKQDKISTYTKAKAIYEAIINSVERIKPLLKKGYENF